MLYSSQCIKPQCEKAQKQDNWCPTLQCEKEFVPRESLCYKCLGMDHLENTTDLYRLEDGSFRLTRGLDEVFENPGKRVEGPTETDSYDLNKIEPPPLNLKTP